jgi:hypothetical protein
MRSLSAAAVLAVLALGGGCSSDPKTPVGAAGSSSGGAMASSGGRSSTGGSGTGGAGGVAPLDCGFDAGADPCRVCLAAYCCDDIVKCLRNAVCAAAFVTYRACETAPNQPDPAKCYSTFFSAVGADSGAEGAGTGLVTTCLLGPSCAVCGGLSVL